MVEKLPAITEVLEPAPKKRGRKPGGGKVPGSGRKAGSPNKVPRDLREVILARGKPLELLCDISRGVKIRVGPQAGPGEPQYAYPTLQERAAAAKILIDKLVAPAAALPAAPAEPNEPVEPMTDIELGRMIAFTLAKAERAISKDDPKPAPPPRIDTDAAVKAEQAEAERNAIADGYNEAVSNRWEEARLAREEAQAAPWRLGDMDPRNGGKSRKDVH